jgi:hypothetical protein
MNVLNNHTEPSSIFQSPAADAGCLGRSAHGAGPAIQNGEVEKTRAILAVILLLFEISKTASDRPSATARE